MSNRIEFLGRTYDSEKDLVAHKGNNIKYSLYLKRKQRGWDTTDNLITPTGEKNYSKTMLVYLLFTSGKYNKTDISKITGLSIPQINQLLKP